MPRRGPGARRALRLALPPLVATLALPWQAVGRGAAAWTPAGLGAHRQDVSTQAEVLFRKDDYSPAAIRPPRGTRDTGRRSATAGLAAAAALILGCAGWAGGARALIKGNAPPGGYGLGKGMSKARECSNKAECEEAGRTKEDAEFGKASIASDATYSKTTSGARFKDMTAGSAADGVAGTGDTVRVRYRVMRSGKRSSDGLSGEGSTIFSWGFGEEDNEPKNAVLAEKLGDGKLVKALDEGIVGMAVGGTRRVQVRPENGLGWRKPGNCAEANQAIAFVSGLPVGGAENNETCIDESKEPKPRNFGAKRRFSRRFDESLIVEVELVGLGAS